MTTELTSDATPNGKKRGQPEGSPLPDSSKKQKLDNEPKATSSNHGTLSSITSAISNAFGFGRQPQNGANGANGVQNVPTAQPAPASAPALAPKRPAIKLAALKGTIWDTEEKPRLASPAKPKTPGRKGRPKGSGSAAKTKSQPSSQTKSLNTSARRNAQDTAPDDSPSKIRSLQKPRSTDAAAGSGREDGEGSGDDDDNQDSDVPATPSSAHKQIPGKRLFGPPNASKTPKGILTPSKNRTLTPSKSVKFDNRSSDMHFKDLIATSEEPKKSFTPRKIKEWRDKSDDIKCVLCKRGHSKAPNQIILCDACDMPVHQGCYGIDTIPDGDWLCRKCDQTDALDMLQPSSPPAEANTPSASIPAAVAVDVPAIPNFNVHLQSYQRVLLDRCAGRRRINMFGQQDVQDKVRQVVEQTVVAGEGNSMLLIGARGSGKTTLLENSIDDLSREHAGEFHVVRLNGFIHTDDKLALKEIWRQLGKEMEVEDDLVNRTNYADTMASLLALLSHPSEIIGTDEGMTSQAVIFIIDEFDMFAAHPRQTLLYNLFDIAQSRKAPIAVLGCTTRIDVVELLEKRVKSRFSHRYVYLTQPRSLPAFWQICKQGLIVDRMDADKEGINTSLEGYSEFQQYWNSKIDRLYAQRAFQQLLQFHYYSTKSPAAFFNEWIMPLALLSMSNLTLDPPSRESELTSLSPPDSRLHLLSTLSDLDLGLLIAAARLDIVAHTDNVNFAMAYDEYSSLVGRQRIQSSASGMLAVGGGVRVWSRGVAGIAWERLISLGLLVPSGIGGGKGHGGLDPRMWKVDVVLEEIPAAVKLSSVLTKWCREI